MSGEGGWGRDIVRKPNSTLYLVARNNTKLRAIIELKPAGYRQCGSLMVPLLFCAIHHTEVPCANAQIFAAKSSTQIPQSTQAPPHTSVLGEQRSRYHLTVLSSPRSRVHHSCKPVHGSHGSMHSLYRPQNLRQHVFLISLFLLHSLNS